MSNKSLSNDLKTFLEDIRHKNRQVLEKRLLELTAAYNIGKEVSACFDLENCLRILVDRIADLMSVEIVSLMLMDKNEKELVVKLAKGLDEEIVREAKVKVGESIAGWIAKTGQSLLIKDMKKDGRFPKRDGKYYTDSLLSVPLKIHDKVIGVINVNNKVSKDIFREKDLDILNTVVDLAAAAIENARLHEEVKALDKLRLDFISNISHDLRTPLAVIKEAVGLILDEIAGNINVEQKKFLELAKQNVGRLKYLIDELLEIAKLESKKTPMKRRLFNIVGVVKEAMTSLGPLAEKKEILLTDLLPDKKIEIWGDADKMSQVVTNLIDNAIKYNKPKGKVEVSLEDVERSVNICVSDTGVGIPAQNLDKIFDRFHRIEIRTKGKAEGWGLGLSITKEIIQMHGAKIWVESTVGKGSKFIVTLPKDLRSQK